MEIKDIRCEVCCEEVAKYKCPRCSKQTCSVKCVKDHKAEAGCSGQRDKSAYVPINKYTENHLLSDYRFLEDVDRARDNVVRNSKKFPNRNHNNKKFLKRAADQKGVHLLFLPNVFTKHKRNSSRTFKESPNNIFWCVNWIFPQSDFADIFERKISDKLTFYSVLKKYLHTTESNPIHRQRLKEYICEDMSNVEIYMEYDRSTQQSKKYYKLDLHKSIEENMKGRLVIEYPTIHVVRKGDTDVYQTKVLTEDPEKEHRNINQRRTNPSRKETDGEESIQCGVQEESSKQEESDKVEKKKEEAVQDPSMIPEQNEECSELAQDVSLAQPDQHESSEQEEGECSEDEEFMEEETAVMKDQEVADEQQETP